MSYSLYLWQQPFLNRHTTALLATFPVNIAAAVGCALVSFTCIEAPMLRLRDRVGSMGRASASRCPRLDSTGMRPVATFESIGRVSAESGDPLHIGYDQAWVNSPFRSS
jgi:peptidoglycan/LPS O-acetylase OafA/YrhL